MLIITFTCTVCEGSFRTEKDWLEHLLSEHHQVGARQQIFEWGAAEREKAFFVTSAIPLATPEILQDFAGKGIHSLLRDFVYFPKHPLVGIFLFESREKSHERFSTLTGPKSKGLYKQVMEIKEGINITSSDWEDQLSSLKPELAQEATVVVESSRVEEVSGRVAIPPKKRRIISSSSDDSSSSDSDTEPEHVDLTVLDEDATLYPRVSRLECQEVIPVHGDVLPTRQNEDDDGLDDEDHDPPRVFISKTVFRDESVDDSDDDNGVAPVVASKPKTQKPKRPRTSESVSNQEPRPGPSSLSLGVYALHLEEVVEDSDGEEPSESPPVPKRRRTLKVSKKKAVKKTSKGGDKTSRNGKKKPKDGKGKARPTKKAREVEDDDMDVDEPAQPFIKSSSFQEENDENDDDVQVIEVKETVVHEVFEIDDNIVAPSSLVQDFNAIRKEMEIPDEEYDTALEFMKTLEIQLAKDFPSCRLIWFRGWYLKLNSTKPLEELSIFLDHKKIFEHLESTDVRVCENTFPSVKKKINMAISNLETGQLGISTLSEVDAQHFAFPTRRYLYCSKNGFTFRLLYNRHLFPQVQACRLITYYCSFDQRIKPLLTVIRYWAKVNEIRLAESGDVWDPTALDWLVIFFLCHKKKIISTPRELGEKPHHKLDFFKFDIGFCEDASFAGGFSQYNETNEEVHAFNVFSLALEFFRFYSLELGLRGGRKVVLNTRDGELIEMKEFCRQSSKEMKTKLSVKEREKARKGRVSKQSGLILLHPLYLPSRVTLDDRVFVNSVCPAMAVAAKKLKIALEKAENGEKDVELMSAFTFN